MGIVERTGEGVFVLEAIEPVSRTPLARFRERGEGGRLLVLRVKGLTDQQRGAVVAAARRHLGKPYDPLFTLTCGERRQRARGSAPAA